MVSTALPPPRCGHPLELTRLRISGFKSFCDPVELLIEAGLTGVVGPNGCGKSNIVEALRWGMGESSAKGLRGDGMDDVIFNGSSSRAAHDVAEVRLRLKGHTGGLSGLDGVEDIEISRKIARGVGSTYRINGREARARDVQLLFADAGAGSRSPAIIGQGQIGFIVDAKPADRRRLLEDAAGIGGLQTRRREAELRLEATQANLQRVLDLLGAQEGRLAELQKQGRQAERYRKLAAELRESEALLLLARWAAAARLARELAEAEAAAIREDAAASANARGARERRAAAAAGLPDLRERTEAQATRAAQLKERLLSLEAAADREAAHLAALERQLQESEADLAQATATAAELATARAARESELAALNDRRAAAEAAMPELAAEEQAAAAMLASLQAELREATGRAAAASAAAQAARQRMEGLSHRQAALAKAQAELPSLAKAFAARDAAAAALATRTAELDAARAALAAAEAVLHEAEPGRETARAALAAAERALVEAGQRVSAAEAELRRARELRAQADQRQRTIERAGQRLAERQKAHAARLDAHEREGHDLDLEAAGAALAAAERELQGADARLDAARAAAAAIEGRRTELGQQQRDLQRSLDALDAEIGVLTTLVAEGVEGALLDQLGVPEDLAAAVGAALGDDLLAGTDPQAPRHWRELPPLAERLQSLPAAATPLATLVQAPSVLALRLRQVGLVPAEAASSLQPDLLPGQRLVSPDGGLWRWDGFVQAPGSEDMAAARVRHRLRLHAAREDRDELAKELAEAQAQLEAVETEHEAARATQAAAEAAWRAADAAQLRARQRLAATEAALQRRAADAARLEAEAAALAGETRELEDERAAALAAEAELGDLAQAGAALEAVRGERAAAEAAARAERARCAEAERAHEAAVRTLRERRTALERAQGALETARAAAERAGREAAEIETARRTREASLTHEAAELEKALATARGELEAARALDQEAAAARAAAETAAGEAEAGLRAAIDRHRAGRHELAEAGRAHDLAAAALGELTRRAVETEARLEQLTTRCGQLRAEHAEALANRRSEPEELKRQAAGLAETEALLAQSREALAQAEAELAALERALEAAEAALASAREGLAVRRTERSHADAALAEADEAVRERLQQEPAALLADEAMQASLAAVTPEELEQKIGKLRASRDRLGPVNLRADLEAQEVEAAIAQTRSEAAELEAAMEKLSRAIATLNKEGRERLMAAFAAVDGHFKDLFTRLFGGGRAQLRLTGADDPLQAGLELEASPPGKKLTSISLLSGGEKTLTALALVFGFFLAEPSPLCVLDEVDAPLDDANVDRFVTLMQEIAAETRTRFLVVTHHPLTMARMDRLYGVTMTERGISRLVSVALEEALELRATA